MDQHRCSHSVKAARRHVKELHFVDVIPLDVLLEAMTTDCSAVSARIQKVLLPSYFPGELSGLLKGDAYTEKMQKRDTYV